MRAHTRDAALYLFHPAWRRFCGGFGGRRDATEFVTLTLFTAASPRISCVYVATDAVCAYKIVQTTIRRATRIFANVEVQDATRERAAWGLSQIIRRDKRRGKSPRGKGVLPQTTKLQIAISSFKKGWK